MALSSLHGQFICLSGADVPEITAVVFTTVVKGLQLCSVDVSMGLNMVGLELVQNLVLKVNGPISYKIYTCIHSSGTSA